MPMFRQNWGSFLLIFAVVVIALIQGMMLGHWLVDDAGISIAYAQNLLKYGVLTSQIGAEQVEGFSNPLWVFILAGIINFGPVTITVKIISGLFFAWSVGRLFLGLRRTDIPVTVIFTLMFFMAFQPAIVIWSFSGLENSLYLAAGVELLVRMCVAISGKATRTDSIFAGLATSVLALTRPEGVMYTPLYFIASFLYNRKSAVVKEASLSFLLPLVCVFGYSIFRWEYFGSLLPTAYFAKGGPTLSHLYEIILLKPYPISKLLYLLSTIYGEALQTWGAVFSILLVAYMLWKESQPSIIAALVLFTAMSVVIYLLLPADWMPEARYGTLFYPSYYLLMITSIRTIMPNRWLSLICVLLVISGIFSFIRIDYFSKHPPISIAEVQDRSDRFARWGRLLNHSRCSILTADAGGFLIRNELDLIDLGMLCDREIAETLGEGSRSPNIKRFHDYVFEQRKPIFIETRAYHAWRANLESDARFRRDYLSIREYPDLWVKKKYNETVLAGDFVRRDIIGSHFSAFEKIHAEAARLWYPFSGN